MYFPHTAAYALGMFGTDFLMSVRFRFLKKSDYVNWE